MLDKEKTMNKEVEEAKERLKESLDNMLSGLLYSQEDKDKDIKTLLNYIQELECEVHDLKVIEEAHQEENGSLRQENYELTAKVTDNICKGVEEEVLEEYRQKIEKLENRNEFLRDLRDRLIATIKEDYIPKQEARDRVKELEELLVDPQCAKNVEYRIYELDRLLGKVE